MDGPCNRKVGRLVTLACLGCLIRCGGSSESLPDPGPSSGLNPTTMLANLTSADHRKICDWVAGRFGGWATSVSCSDGDTFSGPASESSCEQQSMSAVTCTETISDLQDCINQVVGGCQAIPVTCLNLLFDCGMMM